VDLAWVSPVLFLTAPELRNAHPLVNAMRQGGAMYHSVVFTRTDSKIRSPTQLVGARMAWVAKTSAGGYLVPRLTLAARGIRPDDHFREEIFTGSHGGVVTAVMNGEADAGGTYAVFEDGDPTKRLLRSGLDDLGDDVKARVILSAGPIPADLVVARADVPVTARAALVRVFEELADEAHSAHLIARVFNAERFIRFERGALDELLDDVETGRQLGLLDDA
jgi:phosphate/phosphite/phosphonate ABC transporter binding protein